MNENRNGTRPPAPRLSRRERSILELLAGGREMAGLELLAAAPALGRGLVYVALLRLADRGLVDSRPVSPGPGGRRLNGRGGTLPQRLFRATAAAPAALAAGRPRSAREAPAW